MVTYYEIYCRAGLRVMNPLTGILRRKARVSCPMPKNEQVTAVQPAVLKWARESLGLTIVDVAQKLKKSPDIIQSWETGRSFPSYSQLEKLAYDIYKRPIALFFFPKPPEERTHRSEFRTLPDEELENLSSDTHLHIRKAHAYQLSLMEAFDERNPSDDKIWKRLELTPGKSIQRQAQMIREFLGITLEEQSSWSKPEIALKKWREKIEAKGVFIFKESFKQKEISGFCLSHNEFPVIYLNNSTTSTRQIFSLLHELAHLLFQVNGITKEDDDYIKNLPAKEKKLEQFCNAIAAEILIPESDFLKRCANIEGSLESLPDSFYSEIAQAYSVSREVILRKFFEYGKVTPKFYKQKSSEWSAQMKKRGGGNWYSTHASYLSSTFTREVFRKYERRVYSDTKAAELLGIHPKNLEGLEAKLLTGASN